MKFFLKLLALDSARNSAVILRMGHQKKKRFPKEGPRETQRPGGGGGETKEPLAGGALFGGGCWGGFLKKKKVSASQAGWAFIDGRVAVVEILHSAKKVGGHKEGGRGGGGQSDPFTLMGKRYVHGRWRMGSGSQGKENIPRVSVGESPYG